MSVGTILESILNGVGIIVDYLVEILLVFLVLGILYWLYKKFIKKKSKDNI